MSEPNLNTLLSVIELEASLGPDSKGSYHIIMTPQVLLAGVGKERYQRIRRMHGDRINMYYSRPVDPGCDKHQSEWMETK